MHKHGIQFYQNDAAFAELAGGHLSAALGRGDSCILLATSEHAELTHKRLLELGFDADGLQRRLMVLDARELCSMAMVDDAPDAMRLFLIVNGYVSQLATRSSRLAVVSEISPILLGQGWRKQAIQLERLASGFDSAQQPSMLCVYPMSAFFQAGPGLGDMFNLCAEHTQVAIPEVEEQSGWA